MNREKKLIKNTLILTLGTICTKGILFIMTPFFTRWISQEDYGIFDLITTYISLLIPLTSLEIGHASFRLLMDEKKEKNNIISNSLFVVLISCLISTILVFIMSKIYKPINSLFLEILILSLSQIVFTVVSMIVRGLKKVSKYAVSNIVFAFFMILFVFIFVRQLNLGLSGIILGYGLGYFIANIYLFYQLKGTKWQQIKSINKKTIIEMLNFSVPLIPCDISWWIMNVSDRTIISIFLGATSNAIVSVAHKIPNICQNVFNVFHLSWQENAIETLNDNDKDEYYTKIMNSMIVIVTSFSIIILSFNFIIFEYIFTKNYYNAYYQVPIMIVSIIISMLAQFLGGIYIATMNSKKSGYTTAISAVLNIFVHLLLINKVGLYASSVSTLIAYLFLVVIRYHDINKTIKIHLKKESIYIFIVLLYFVISVYINNQILNIINIILALIVFILTNKNNVKRLFQKVVKK